MIQTGTTHYAAYAQYRDVVTPLIVEWFDRYLVARRGPSCTSDAADAEIIRLTVRRPQPDATAVA